MLYFFLHTKRYTLLLKGVIDFYKVSTPVSTVLDSLLGRDKISLVSRKSIANFLELH